MYQTKFLDKLKTHFMFCNFFPDNRAFCEIMQKNMVQPETPQMITQHGACASHAG